jgi:DNA-binding IclR family transcriptional regulator
MACVKPDGSLTATGLAALTAVAASPGVPALAVAKALGKPLFIARGILRELGEAGLLEPEAAAGTVEPAAETHRVTAEGQACLARVGAARP